jgi:hypothetical protein
VLITSRLGTEIRILYTESVERSVEKFGKLVFSMISYIHLLRKSCLVREMFRYFSEQGVGGEIFFFSPLTPNDPYSGRTAPLTSKRCILYIFIQQIWVLNILNMVYTLRFFCSSNCSLFHNSNVFGSCIIHILYTGCAKIKKNNSDAKSLMYATRVCGG